MPSTSGCEREPFQAWLDDATRPSGDDGEAGTVLLWHEDGALAHAAVTLGDGWAFHKPSQGWMSPWMVLTVRELINASRAPGLRLSRRDGRLTVV